MRLYLSQKSNLILKPCTTTMGKPFVENSNALCPLYVRIKIYLEKKGWEEKIFTPTKTKNRDMCYIKFEGGAYYGYRPLCDKGFELHLFSKREDAEVQSIDMLSDSEEDWPPREIVEICWSEVGG